MSEMLDVFDDRMQYLGQETREEVHRRGLWHQTFHCWIIRRNEGKPSVVFQRRGPHKKDYPNCLDITAAGHMVAGETRESGLRELNEELGINADTQDLRYLGIRLSSATAGLVINREFAHVYLLEWNEALDCYRLEPDEVSGVAEIPIDQGLLLFSGSADTAMAQGFQVDDSGVKHNVSFAVTRDDVIPRIDSYYLKIFIMADRYFEGKPYLAI